MGGSWHALSPARNAGRLPPSSRDRWSVWNGRLGHHVDGDPRARAALGLNQICQHAAATVAGQNRKRTGMNPPIFERARAVIAILWLLQSLLGCAAAQEATQGPWTRVAPMPTARSELAATALEGRIYVAGGIAQWGTTAAFEAYDPTTDRWEGLPPLPEAAHHLAAAATDDRIYVTGGYTNLLFTEITDRAWAYDPRARRWARIPDLPAPRAAHGMAAIEGKLYVVGGVGMASEDLWVYDPATELGKPRGLRSQPSASTSP
jgi:hypothetical protein